MAMQQLFDFPSPVEQGHRLGEQLPTQCIEQQALAQAVEQLAIELSLQFCQ